MKPPRLLITATLLLALPAQAVRTNELVGSFKIAAELARRSSQELAVTQAAAIITTYIASAVDPDGDPFPEPPPFLTGAGPAGGGLVPTLPGLGAPISDGYGGKLGYCAWDNGAARVSTGRLPGNASDTGAITFAVVSAGLDGVFNRSCAQIASGAVFTDDDFVVTKNTEQIRQGVGGTVYFGDPVADVTALGLLTSGIKDGELRLMKSNNTLWRWNAGTWEPVANTYAANNVAVTGGTINGTAIGNTTPSSGAFTTLSGTLTGNVTGNLTGNVIGNVTGNVSGNVSGNAGTASKLFTPRSLSISGDATWSAVFDGSTDVSSALTLANSGVTAGIYGSSVSVPTFTVDAKGRLTYAANLAITPTLSSLTGAAATNTLSNGINAQYWNWQLAGNGSAFSIGETAASTGGSGTQYLMNIATRAGSTAVPLAVFSRGVEAMRIDAVNPQIVANAGSANAPSYAFAGDQSTGLYSPAAGQLAASVTGTRSLWISTGSFNTALGQDALKVNSIGIANNAFGSAALSSNTMGSDNTAIGDNALYNNVGGGGNTAVGGYALRTASGSRNTALGRFSGYTATNPITTADSTFLGYSASIADNATTAGSGAITLLGANTSASLGVATPTAFMTAIGSGASVTTINTVVLGRAADATVIGATGDDGTGATNKLQVTGGIKSTGTVTAPTFAGALTGNASTATALQTARAINGVSFDGTAAITIPANTTFSLTAGSYLTGSAFNG
ncbi:MAG: hypothetical protein GZ090_08850, partial [Oxalobacteraceae bacterium]|nr:hypothetical protein [Oxalobacteraceae bacterium]